MPLLWSYNMILTKQRSYFSLAGFVVGALLLLASPTPAGTITIGCDGQNATAGPATIPAGQALMIMNNTGAKITNLKIDGVCKREINAGATGNPGVNTANGQVIKFKATCGGVTKCWEITLTAQNRGIDLDMALEEAAECGVLNECPAVSQWGVGVLVLLVLTAGTIVVRRHRARLA
jgi:hypothetical protein